MTLWRRALIAVLRPLLVFCARRMEVADPWQREVGSIWLALKGTGARHDFAWYFDGASSVRVRTIDDVQTWLDDCRYVADEKLFREPDHWQHPCTFEQLQRGDCEDYALWAWRKLLELGYDADFVVGRRAERDSQGGIRLFGSRHAWIMFRQDGKEYLYEPGVRDRTKAIRPLIHVRDGYMPEFGVGPRRRTFFFAGFYLSLRLELLGQDREPVGTGAVQHRDQADETRPFRS
jgi:hypothetical protein